VIVESGSLIVESASLIHKSRSVIVGLCGALS
jgi:hypothetical protein